MNDDQLESFLLECLKDIEPLCEEISCRSPAAPAFARLITRVSEAYTRVVAENERREFLENAARKLN